MGGVVLFERGDCAIGFGAEAEHSVAGGPSNYASGDDGDAFAHAMM